MGVQVTIEPLNMSDDTKNPEWEWNVEIIVGGNVYVPSDEDGNFTIEMSGIDAFGTADDAFHWAYRWLTSRGYDTNYMELVMKPIYSKEFHRMKARV